MVLLKFPLVPVASQPLRDASRSAVPTWFHNALCFSRGFPKVSLPHTSSRWEVALCRRPVGTQWLLGFYTALLCFLRFRSGVLSSCWHVTLCRRPNATRCPASFLKYSAALLRFSSAISSSWWHQNFDDFRLLVRQFAFFPTASHPLPVAGQNEATR